MTLEPVTIVGAGIAGCALSALLANQGYPIELYESQGDNAAGEHGRSINLALSSRGSACLRALGLLERVRAQAVPMLGRMVHDGTMSRFDPYDLTGNHCLLSVRRTDLLRALREHVAGHPKVRLELDRRVENVSLAERRLRLSRAGAPSKAAYRWLVGADGFGSVVRAALAEAGCVKVARRVHEHVYKELQIPRAHALRAKLRPDALHIWPRSDMMLIALPNADGSFTGTLFFAVPRSEDPRQLLAATFRAKLADAVPLAPDLDLQLSSGPIGRIATVECHEWTPAEAVLVGDAAHTMAPFFGQGMNCALEDCLLLARRVEADGLAAAFTAFPRERQPDAGAINAMSLANYQDMCEGVRDPRMPLRRALERELQRRHSERWAPLYSLVSFSTLPYAEAERRGALQTAIVNGLLDGCDRLDEVDFDAAGALIAAELPALPALVSASFRPTQDAQHEGAWL